MRGYLKGSSVGYLSILLVCLLAVGVAADQHGAEAAEEVAAEIAAEPIQLQELVVVGVGTRGQGMDAG